MVPPLIRPCFLVVDREHSGSISTRKLVIETAKFNVITAYSGAEAIQTLKRFPAIDGVVIDAGITDLPCSEVVKQFKAIQRDVIVVAVGTLGNDPCVGADHYLENFDPSRLLKLLQKLQPERTAIILQMDEKLSDPNG
jgi:CheY-like chemotaxis protein